MAPTPPPDPARIEAVEEARPTHTVPFGTLEEAIARRRAYRLAQCLLPAYWPGPKLPIAIVEPADASDLALRQATACGLHELGYVVLVPDDGTAFQLAATVEAIEDEAATRCAVNLVLSRGSTSQAVHGHAMVPGPKNAMRRDICVQGVVTSLIAHDLDDLLRHRRSSNP